MGTKVHIYFVVYEKCTCVAANPAMPATPRVLHIWLPTIVPIPRSDSVIKVPITFIDISGIDVAEAINVAAATSGVIFKS